MGWNASPEGEREHSARSSRHAAGLLVLKAEQKSLAAADVSQRLLIWRAEELIAQPEPATQLWRRVCCRPRPTLVCEVCVECRKPRILSEKQQCDSWAFRHRQFKIACVRQANYCLTDQRRLGCPIHELSGFGLPPCSRIGELMVGDGCAT